jgi:hypothetical protein
MKRAKLKGWNEIVADSLDNYTVKIDEPDASTTYIGKAKFGASTADGDWSIKKIVVSGTVTTISWADGTDNDIKVWDNRTSYTYS